jgi:hypothetical protein
MNKLQKAVYEEIVWRATKLLEERGYQPTDSPQKRLQLVIGQFFARRTWIEVRRSGEPPYWNLSIHYHHHYPDNGRVTLVLDLDCPPRPHYVHELGMKLLPLLRREMILEDLADV